MVEPSSLELVLQQAYPQVFMPSMGLPPQRDIEHKINLQPQTNPIRVWPYCYPHIQKVKIKKMVKDMCAAVIIQPSTSPFSSPILLVHKKDQS